ncbi:hypothetical protein L1987_45577 [Smallanthus sonchifolius]|uniref:Uncharacterized protein n=1 Tax=Smallanthus sonchifolius TaxID=185202 RepID=A0ACB9FX89_9ASTR|nr:hypothetical protein L1987_45577 [Smallanthus sonchifolius]
MGEGTSGRGVLRSGIRWSWVVERYLCGDEEPTRRVAGLADGGTPRRKAKGWRQPVMDDSADPGGGCGGGTRRCWSGGVLRRLAADASRATGWWCMVRETGVPPG